MNPQEAMAYLDGLQVFGSKLGLDNISYLCEKLENPQQDLKVIHVAGTNGKGSVCAMVSTILQGSGFKVGRYVSPYLVDFSEKITVNEVPISEPEIAKYVEKLAPIAAEMASSADLTHPTYFEVVTAAAFMHFAEKNVDYVVLEVGLGGRLDATNVVVPEVSVITNISLEHTDVLGKTIEKVAGEKAGIIKQGIPVITAASGEALGVIRKVAEENSSKLTEVTEPYQGKLNLMGDFQKINAAVAIETISQLNLNISEEKIQKSLQNVNWPGRMQQIGNFLLDCAHNPAGVDALIKSLPDKNIILVFGCLKDKNYKSILSKLGPVADKIILTKPQYERALPIAELLKEAPDSTTAETVAEALEKAQGMAQAEDLILVTGSCYVVGEALSHLTPA